jgi:nucleoside-diphosphate-sugar epimerase
MDKIIVTGSSGFIGTNLCRRLAEEGYEVHAIDIKPPEFKIPSAVETHILDLTTRPKVPKGDAIVHLAAHSQVQPIVENPNLTVDNISMTHHILSEADRMDAVVINTSSRDVYGNALRPSEKEASEDTPNGYAASKLSSEASTNAFSHTHGVSATSLRLANVYGPMDINQRLIPTFISLAQDGEELNVYGEGKLLDFVHVQDVCNAIISAIQRHKLVTGEAINIGTGVGTPLTEVAENIANSCKSCPGYTVTDDRNGDVGQYVSNISKSKDLLNFTPEHSIQEGLSETIAWYRNHPNLLSSIRS